MLSNIIKTLNEGISSGIILFQPSSRVLEAYRINTNQYQYNELFCWSNTLLRHFTKSKRTSLDRSLSWHLFQYFRKVSETFPRWLGEIISPAFSGLFWGLLTVGQFQSTRKHLDQMPTQQTKSYYLIIYGNLEKNSLNSQSIDIHQRHPTLTMFCHYF